MDLIIPDRKLLYSFINDIKDKFVDWLLLDPMQSNLIKTLQVKVLYSNTGRLIMKGKDLSNSLSLTVKNIYNIDQKEDKSWTFFIKDSKFKHQIKILPQQPK